MTVLDVLGTSVVPPGEKLNGFDDRTLFIDALAMALYESEEFGNEHPLNALRREWPEAVKSHIPEAKRLIGDAKAPVPEIKYPVKQVLESRPEPARRLAYS